MKRGCGWSFARSTFSQRMWPTAVTALALLGASYVDAMAADIDIWLDPGHGGRDAGARGFDQVSVYPEKVATLELSDRIFNLLGTAGFTTFMTRYTDSYPTLPQRVSMAEGLRANENAEIGTSQAFVSIHMNSNKSSTPFGSEVYYGRYRREYLGFNDYRADSGLARSVYNGLIQNTPLAFMGCNSNRGVKAAGFHVISWPFALSVLVEVGFISNQCQQTRVRQGGNQGLLASGIVSGITNAITPGGVAVRASDVGWASNRRPVAPWAQHGAAPQSNQPSEMLSFGESFDDGAFPPSGWMVTSAGQPAPHFWARQTDGNYVNSGAGAATVVGRSAGVVDEWLISPMTFLGASDRGLRFFWKGNPRWAAQVNAQCLVRPKGAPGWSSLWSLQSESQVMAFRYTERVVDVSSWLGDSVQVAFRVAGTNGADFAVDDVLVGDLAPAPTPPGNDNCATAQALPVGIFAIAGSTCSATNGLDPYHDNSFSCTSDELSGSDVFYVLTAAAGDTLEVNVSGDWQSSVYVVSACDTAVASCVAASQVLEVSDTASVATLTHVFAAGGTYYLGVDGVGGDCGDFVLSGFFRGPVTGVGDDATFAGPIALSASPNPTRGTVTFSGRVSDLSEGPGTISIFDAAGRRVWENAIRAASGRFESTWDGRLTSGQRAPSGAYIVRAKFGAAEARSTVVMLE